MNSVRFTMNNDNSVFYKAVAYIYGMGAVVGAWDALRERDRTASDSAMALVRGALRDLGDDTFAEWEQLGRDYADKY